MVASLGVFEHARFGQLQNARPFGYEAISYFFTWNTMISALARQLRIGPDAPVAGVSISSIFDLEE